MLHLLKQAASAHGESLRILSIDRLQQLQNEIELFAKNEELNGFQKWIVSQKYQFEPPVVAFTIRSILIVAIPHPAFANVGFVKQGQSYHFASLVHSDFERSEKDLRDFLAPQGYHIQSAPNLPMKRLAAHSGLAVYGRNNICYVEEMGSFFSFAAYFSDIPCEQDDWTEIRRADRCAQCKVCLNACPTGAIRKDRFLIDNERCLSYFNESPGEFPDWLPLSVHHTLYDCLKCQLSCPMNKKYVNNVLESIQFSEDETNMLLSGSPFETFSPELKHKSEILGLDEWIDAIPRNLRVLFELSEQSLSA